jgi:N-acetylmuramoyl-L-alanine amidase
MSAIRVVGLSLSLLLAAAGVAVATEPPPGFPAGSVVPSPSIHQEELELHDALGTPAGVDPPLRWAIDAETVARLTPRAPVVGRTVYGFLPYWVVSDISHVQWDLLTHVAYFSAEMASDGSITALHNWPTGGSVQALINTAHANGVKVTLTATLMSSSAITTLLSSATYRQNAINNLKSQMLAGNADGINIDFEGMSSTQKANFVTFMTDLTTAIHAAKAGSHVSCDTPAVDWSGAFDFDALAVACDGLFIMGYDYYYGGSTTAGPCAPLTGGGVWGTYNITWTVNDYLTYGGTANRGKLILGLPYYGREWPTSSSSIPSSATPPATTKLYDAARVAAASYGRLWDGASKTPYYVYSSSGWHQGFYDDAESLGLKWDLVNTDDLGGTGMWALNYDLGDDLLWNAIRAKFATTSGSLAGVKIGIDPGHGGTDPGAVGPTSLAEATVNLATSLYLRDALVAQGASCYLTRTEDSTVSLTARTDYFNSIPVDRAESCHFNASGTVSANYTGVHVYADSSGNCLASATSKDLAKETALRLDAALSIGVVSSNCDAIHGVHGDNFHMVRETSMPAMLTEASFISNPTEEGLLWGTTRRCTIAGAIAKGIEDHFGAGIAEPPCAGPVVGTCGNPKVIASFPYSDSDTTVGKSASMDAYSCAPTTSEAGPEVVYRYSVRMPGNLTVTVSDPGTPDIDPHLLTSCSPASCVARNNTTFTSAVRPGTGWIVCDTWTDSGGTQYPGAYTMTATFASTAGDTTAPSAVSNLRADESGGGRWLWSAVTLDRNGGSETMGHYELWRATAAGGPYSLQIDNIAAASVTDTSAPTGGACWYYDLRPVDAAGNRVTPDLAPIRDNPAASFVGSWSTGNSASGRYGDDYRFVSTETTGTKSATWSVVVDETGLYDVSVYYPAGTNRSTASRFTVSDAYGSTLYTVNQQTNGGSWLLLGSHWLIAGSTATVVLDNTGTTGFVVLADAVKWTKVP